MTAPTLSERLREQRDIAIKLSMRFTDASEEASLLCEIAEHLEEGAEAAAEIERLTSQLEAAGLAKPAYHQPPYVDGYFGER